MTLDSPPSRPIRVGVIGLGVGEQHAIAFDAHRHAELAMLCDVDVQRLGDVGRRFPHAKQSTDWLSVTSDPSLDVVAIATHDGDHASHVLAALRHGKHVFVEKPLCTRPDDLTQIQSALRAAPMLQLSSNLVLRREPRFLELHARIRSGELGTPFLLEGSYDYGRLHKLTDGWRGREAGYSVMHGGGIHLIDLLTWLNAGADVDEVVAHGSRLASRESAFKGRDLINAILRFSDGALGRVTANFASVTPHHHQVSVYGTAGTFQQTHAGAGYLWKRDPLVGNGELGTHSADQDVNPYPVASKGALASSFVDLLRGSPSDCPTASDVIKVMSVSLAIEASLERGLPVRIEEFNT